VYKLERNESTQHKKPFFISFSRVMVAITASDDDALL